MNNFKFAVLGAFTAMTVSLASASYANVILEPCDCQDEPTEPTKPTKGNNGLGNGDQTAPGNSLENNKAENQVGNPGHASGKAQNSN